MISWSRLRWQVWNAEQNLVEFAAASEGKQLIESADHRQPLDLFHLRPVVGNADEP